jgi:hypothetical protein
MTTLGNILRIATLAGALALAAQPALALGGQDGWGGGWNWGVAVIGVAPPWRPCGCALRRVQVQTNFGLRWRSVRYCV